MNTETVSDTGLFHFFHAHRFSYCILFVLLNVFVQWVGSIDFAPNEIADVNIVVAPAVSWGEQNEEVNRHVKEILGEDKVDAILCVAGGWAGGNAASERRFFIFIDSYSLRLSFDCLNYFIYQILKYPLSDTEIALK